MRITINDHKAVSWNKMYVQGHWKKRQALAKFIHGLVKISAVGSHPIKKRSDITITAYFKDKRRHDSDNIAAKLYIDGLKGSVIKDDDTRYIRRVTTEAKIGQKEDKVVIELK